MKIIVCIDDKNGMLFNFRRQSQDEILKKRILEITKNSKLLMNNYSAKQFNFSSEICVCEDFISQAKNEDYCFIENNEIPEKEKIDEFIIYKWNRKYPADVFFNFDFKKNGFKKISSEDFKGSSHEKITEEIYIKK